MKRTYFIFGIALFCFVMSACSDSRNQNDITESLPPESQSSISESEITLNPVTEQSAVQNMAVSSLPSSEEYIKQVVQDTIPKFAKPDMSEYEKVKAAFDYLIEIGYYTRPIALDVWRFRSTGDMIPSYEETRSLNMLLFGFGTCEDYAASLMMLLEEMGIETRYMTGLISGVDAKLSEYLPEAADTDKSEITLRQLLTHTGGFEWYEWGGGYSNFFEWRDSDNWVDYILNRQMVAQPDSTFNYTTGGTHLLAAVLQQVTGKNALEYGQEHIFGPMGMDSVEWGADPQGIMDGGNGLLMNARDMAKFGQMFLNGGKWHDQQLVPETWVKQSSGLQYERPGYDSYGYQWWLRSLGAENYDTYFAMGAWGQFIFVVPELNLVTVMTATHRDNTYLPRTYFSDYILAACA